MKVKLLHIDEFVKLNSLDKITSPMLFEKGGVAHENGLLSNVIFGNTTNDRKNTFAYISLKGKFLHPHAYKAIKRIFRNIDTIINGSGYYSIDKDGYLFKDELNGSTGIEWLYKNFDKIQWKETGGSTNERIFLLKNNKKDVIFVDKFTVIPVFYRDVLDTSSGGDDNDLNKLYTTLIRLNQADNGYMLDFTYNNTNMNIQLALVALYDYFKSKLEKKNGLIRKYLLGKNVDLGVRSVITNQSFDANHIDDMKITFKYAGMPMSQALVCVYPFVISYLMTNFNNEIINKSHNFEYTDEKGELKRLKLYNPDIYYNDNYFKKRINKFISNPSSRFDKIEIPIEGADGKVITDKYFLMANKYIKGTDESTTLNRPLTWTDILYIALEDICKDKHVVVTRYPVNDIFGLFYSKIRIISTNKTKPMMVNNKLYKFYPDIDLKIDKHYIVNQFADTMVFSNAFLAVMSADFDGDQITAKILWEQNANIEAAEKIKSKSYLFKSNGTNARVIENEAVQALFTLTKAPFKDSKYVPDDIVKELLAMDPNDITKAWIEKIFATTLEFENGKPKIIPPKFMTNDKIKLTPKMYPYIKEDVETTIGKLIFNRFIVEKLGLYDNGIKYINEQLGAGGLKKFEMFSTKSDTSTFIDYIDRRDFLLLNLYHIICVSYTERVVKTSPKVRDYREKLIAKHVDKLDSGDVNTAALVEKELIDIAHKELEGDLGLDLFDSGARGSFGNNYKNNNLFKGPVLNYATGKYDIVKSALIDGISKKELPIMARSELNAAYPKAVGTAVSGYLSKQLNAALQTVVLDKRGSDCGTKNTITITLNESDIGDFIFRYVVDNGKIVKLTYENFKNYINKPVQLRSIMMCTADKKCNVCSGDMKYEQGIINIGFTGSTVGSAMTGLGMKKFHDPTIKLHNISNNPIL